MGDECHNRNAAATSLFARRLASAIVRTAPADRAAQALDFLAQNDHFFLNLSMAACKATMDAAHGIEGSTVVTAMARNGVEFGIRVSGTGDAWFTAPATVPDGLVLPRLRPRRRQPGPRRQRHHRDARHRRLRDGGGPGHRAVRGRHGRGRARLHPRDAADHPGPATPTSRCRRSGSSARRRRSTCAGSSRAGRRRSSTPASRTASRASGRSAPGIARAPLACFADALREVGRRLDVGGAS